MFAFTVTVPTVWLVVLILVVVMAAWFWGFWWLAKNWVLPWTDEKIEKATAKARAKVNAEYGQDGHSGSEQ